MSAEGPSRSSNMHKTGRREEGATHIFISSVSEASCTCRAQYESLLGVGPGEALVLVTCEHPEQESREGISQAQNIFFSPSTLLSSFSLPLLLFNLWFNVLKNGGRYCVKQCSKNEAQLQ